MTTIFTTQPTYGQYQTQYAQNPITGQQTALGMGGNGVSLLTGEEEGDTFTLQTEAYIAEASEAGKDEEEDIVEDPVEEETEEPDVDDDVNPFNTKPSSEEKETEEEPEDEKDGMADL